MIEQRVISNSLVEIYISGGGNFITESFPTNFHTFCKRKVMAKGERIEDYKEVTASERTKLETADAAWERPPQLLIDEWNVAFRNGKFGRYNESTGYFEGNNVLDITTEQALEILRFGTYGESASLYRAVWEAAGEFPKPRTTVPTLVSDSYHIYYYYIPSIFGNWLPRRLETIRFFAGYTDGGQTAYIKESLNFIAYSLKAIYDKITPKADNLRLGSYLSDGHNPLLTTLFIHKLAYNLGMRYLKALSYDTMLYLVENSAATSPITVTVHPDILAKMSGDTSNDAAAALSPEEAEKWQTLIPLGAEKNITFATT